MIPIILLIVLSEGTIRRLYVQTDVTNDKGESYIRFILIILF